MRTLVLVPLKIELKFLKEALEKEGFSFLPSEKIKNFACFDCSEKPFSLVHSGQGKVQSALRGLEALHVYKDSNLLLSVGSAGALDSGIGIGSVVIAEKTLEHDFKSSFKKNKKPLFKGSASLIQKIKSLSLENIFYGTVASGDEDILSTERAKELQKETSALAASWEGAGVGRLAAFKKIDFLEIRGITDLCLEDFSLKDFEASLGIAMGRVAKLLQNLGL